jgi:hypothetical protein
MYEIWLVMNIVWEIALGLWPVLAVGAVVWLVLLILASRRPTGCWRRAWPTAAATAGVAALIGFVSIPATTRSSLLELAYWVDWANLASIAAGVGVAALAFAWPIGVLWNGRREGGRADPAR